MPKAARIAATKPVWPPPLPPDESEEARAVRLTTEEEAKKVSDSIDQSISVDRERRKRTPSTKILLLGMLRPSVVDPSLSNSFLLARAS